jgi:serine/threonine protein kinase
LRRAVSDHLSFLTVLLQVASYMRAVLRTLAQCHSHHILHRDIKPGNFMLLDDSERAPLKAIDFGLAVPYDPDCLPLTDLGLEGTPWCVAPAAAAAAAAAARVYSRNSSSSTSTNGQAQQQLVSKCSSTQLNPWAASLHCQFLHVNFSIDLHTQQQLCHP